MTASIAKHRPTCRWWDFGGERSAGVASSQVRFAYRDGLSRRLEILSSSLQHFPRYSKCFLCELAHGGGERARFWSPATRSSSFTGPGDAFRGSGCVKDGLGSKGVAPNSRFFLRWMRWRTEAIATASFRVSMRSNPVMSRHGSPVISDWVSC